MANIPYPPEPSSEQINHLVSLVKDWTMAHGLAMRPPPTVLSTEVDPYGILATSAPVTLFPSPFPRICFEQAQSIQKAYNELYAFISQDEEFLKDVVEQILEADEFIAQLWEIHLIAKQEGYIQNLSLGLFRSDYMVHQDFKDRGRVPVIKQVEFNTIASSFGGLSFKTSRLHRYLSKGGFAGSIDTDKIEYSSMPENTSTHSLAMGIRVAFEAYIKQGSQHQCCVIFLVQDPEKNIFDQRHLEYELELSEPMIPVFRLAFADILSYTTIADTSKRQLLYHPPHKLEMTFEAAVVYFRAGYGPSDYLNASAWQARLQIERSNAIKCPSILTQLAGAKKVQQVLATPTPASTPSLLNRFIKNDPRSVGDIEKTFANIFPLDSSPAGMSARRIALDEELCKGYVLKPQREGGGNNVYRVAIPPFLRSIPEPHWKSYILMVIITPPPVHNMILRNGIVENGGVICELGIYGTCLWGHKTKEMLYNQTAGYLLRTKGDKSEEGGVAAGYGAMDSCLLV